jgi:DNA-binding CsgD family transcriptional regulator
LTPTEHSVAELVAEGLTNRQIAERLFLSRHTVGFHLRSIFRKLSVTSRVDLTRLVGQRVVSTPAVPAGVRAPL